MPFPIVLVDLNSNTRKPAIIVSIDGSNPDKAFPLTRKGAALAGQYLHEIGCEHWLYSSSCNLPDDYKPRCRLDVCTQVEEGYNAAWARAQS